MAEALEAHRTKVMRSGARQHRGDASRLLCMGSSSARVQAILELVHQLSNDERAELDEELQAEELSEDELDAELVRRASQALNDPASTEPVEDVIERMRARW